MTIPKTLYHEALHAAAIEHLGGKVEYIQLRRGKNGRVTGGTTRAEPCRWQYFREAYILQAPSLATKTSPGDDMDLATLPDKARREAWARLEQDRDVLLSEAHRIAQQYMEQGEYRTRFHEEQKAVPNGTIAEWAETPPISHGLTLAPSL